MHSVASARRFAVLLLLGSGLACAQSSLPATGPTVASPQMSAAPAADSARRARVVYSGGQLEITADDSSLDQILHEISRETGMKITGGVKDERVFGKYGPGAAAEILESLLDGTGSNMLLRETASKAPAELILTQREGGPTPPNPNARGYDDEVREEPAPPPAPIPQVQPAAEPEREGRTEAATAPATPSAGAGAGNPTSPSAAQTPQQIFEQLQRLQQTQQSPSTH